MTRTRTLLAVLLLLIGVSLAGAQGPFSAQIQLALRGFASTAQTVTGLWTFTTNFAVPAVAVVDLPTCNAANNNKVAFVTDANSPTLGGAVTNGGALSVGVRCINGTGWRVF